MNAFFTGSLIIIFPVLLNTKAGTDKKTTLENRVPDLKGLYKPFEQRLSASISCIFSANDSTPTPHPAKGAALAGGSLKDSIIALSHARNALAASLRSKDSLIRTMRSRDSVQTSRKKKDSIPSSARLSKSIPTAAVKKDSIEVVSNLRQAGTGFHKGSSESKAQTKDSAALTGARKDPMRMSLNIERVSTADNTRSFNLKPAAETKGSLESETGKNSSVLSTPPVFPKGEDVMKTKLKEYVKSHYPSQAKKNDTEGTVVVNFFVEKDGSIDKIRIFSGLELNFEIPETAIKAIKSLKKFKPATENGLPISANMNVPVEFRF